MVTSIDVQHQCLNSYIRDPNVSLADKRRIVETVKAKALQASAHPELNLLEDAERKIVEGKLSSVIASCTLTLSAMKCFLTLPSVSSTAFDGEENSIIAGASRLPALKFKSFDGSILEWLAWWERFESDVHSNSKLNDTQRFSYLLSYTSGEAKKLIEGLSKTACNYNVAINKLKERYGNADKLAKAYVDELQNLAIANDASSQRYNFDVITTCVNNLEMLKRIKDEKSYKDLILEKFNFSVRYFVYHDMAARYQNKDQNKEEERTLKTMLSILGDIIKMQEDAASHSSVAEATDFLVAGANEKRLAAPGLVAPSAKRRRTNPSGVKEAGCIFCLKRHVSQDCRTYPTILARKTRLQDLKACMNCGKGGHDTTACYRQKGGCSYCKKDNHTIPFCYHYTLRGSAGPSGVQPSTIKWKSNKPTGTFFQTFNFYVHGPFEQQLVKGMFDPGSKFSYILNELVTNLKLHIGSSFDLNVGRFGTTDTLKIKAYEVNVPISNLQGCKRTLRLLSTDCISGAFELSPAAPLVRRILPLRSDYADPDIFSQNNKPLVVLIGMDYYHTLTDITKSQALGMGIYIFKSFFGWIPSGTIQSSDSEKSPNNAALIATLQENKVNLESFNPDDLQFLWSLEALGIKESENEHSEDIVLQKFRETFYLENGRCTVRWPWKTDHPSVPSHFRLARARLNSLLEKSSTETLDQIEQVLKSQLEAGIIEPAPRNSHYPKSYLPFRPIFTKGKPLPRLVYDASAKTKSEVSLNSLMHPGPDLIKSLVGLLINFRLNHVAISADIEKAFLMISLQECDRDVVRFLWVNDPSKPLDYPNNTVVYRFARVPFGVVASPFLLNMTLQEILTEPNASDEWHLKGSRSFYVDNFLTSVPKVDDAINFFKSLTSRLNSVGFNLRDWCSNNQTFIDQLPETLVDSTTEKIKVLGMMWNKFNDTLSIKLNADLINGPGTKRKFLAFFASIYDPLGLYAPATLELKLFLQQCWKDKFTWDEQLPTSLDARRVKLSMDVRSLPSLEIPRTLWQLSPETFELHVFCDASKKAYACAAYLVGYSRGEKTTAAGLIYAKVRLSPLNENKTKKLDENTTIPRLELLGVTIGSTVITYLRKELNVALEATYLWTDATTVLQWLCSSSVLPKFVSNQVQKIKRVPNVNIKYVPTETNPADIATRGLKASQLINSDLWWKGPYWLINKNQWPSAPETTQPYTTPVFLVTETRNKISLLTDSLENNQRLCRWSSYVRIYEMVWKFILIRLKYPSRLRYLSANLLVEGEKLLVRQMQMKYFKTEIAQLKRKIKPPSQLDLKLDERNILCCEGRLRNAKLPWTMKEPMLLARKSRLTRFYIAKVHVENHHVGASHTLVAVRERFWVQSGFALVKSVIHRCRVCRVWTGGSFALPPMPPLPRARVEGNTPFLRVGIDYFGPITIKDANGKPTLVYVCLVVCLLTRAVHLELVDDLSGDHFLMALIRFTTRRRVPKLIISDNATNFTFIQPLVGKKVRIEHHEVNDYVSNNNIEWVFIPAYSPWQGGFYERLVGLVKNCLRKAHGFKFLTSVQTTTALCQIEETINNRPLTQVGEDFASVLTPNKLLYPHDCNKDLTLEVSTHKVPSSKEDLIKHWRETLDVVEETWSYFYRHYLLALRAKHVTMHRTPRGSVTRKPRVGEIVVVQLPSAPRATWPLGIIESLDKRQATAEVRYLDKTHIRSINHLYPLEVEDDPN